MNKKNNKKNSQLMNEKNKKNKENVPLAISKDYLGHDIQEWLNSAKIRCKKSTYTNYLYTVNARIIPRFAKIKKKNITTDIINQYTTDLLNKGLAPKTVKDIIIILNQILKYAGINQKLSMPKVPKNEIQILKKEEQQKLEEILLQEPTPTTFGIYFCLYTGLRIGEICALKWENIDLENKKIKINKTIARIKNPDPKSKKKNIIILEDPKSISSIREIPIPDFILSALKQLSINTQPSHFLVTGSNKFIETRSYFNRYKKILCKANLEEYNFHALRHTFATRCIENGCDPKTLSEILGHSNVQITLERYVHPNYENKVKMMNQIKPLFHM